MKKAKKLLMLMLAVFLVPMLTLVGCGADEFNFKVDVNNAGEYSEVSLEEAKTALSNEELVQEITGLKATTKVTVQIEEQLIEANVNVIAKVTYNEETQEPLAELWMEATLTMEGETQKIKVFAPGDNFVYVDTTEVQLKISMENVGEGSALEEIYEPLQIAISTILEAIDVDAFLADLEEASIIKKAQDGENVNYKLGYEISENSGLEELGAVTGNIELYVLTTNGALTGVQSTTNLTIDGVNVSVTASVVGYNKTISYPDLSKFIDISSQIPTM